MRPLAVPVAEACAMIGVGRTRLYEEIAAGRLVPRKSGRRTLFLTEDLERYVRSLPVAGTAQEGASDA